MNAVEIEEAVSELASNPFHAATFPYAFLEAFGNPPTTIQRLKRGNTNQSDLPGAVLQRNNVHIKVCAEGQVPATLCALRESPATSRQKAKFILATDGKNFEAESLEGEGETLACAYPDFHNHFGFFLPLAGISTVRQIRENAFDIKATGRLNKLYIELLKNNPDWDTEARRQDMNHFMARLIFCFFAEDTDIFHGKGLFTSTIDQMTKGSPEITNEVISELFRAMNVPVRHEGQLDNRYREAAGIKSWANVFPYVNGGLFSDSVEVPKFSKIARSYLLHIGNLDWTKINPDIFGSMIQAVADDEERGDIGMHYTSVPNILKVLNPLFLDDLRGKLEEAADNPRKLLNLRQRIAHIRVFDPACGSGNFLVIAYKEMRAIEAEVNRRRGETERRSDISTRNFCGIEIRHFSCEIARLALTIAEYQCDVLYRGQQLALAEFLPLEAANWIEHGNALRIDWLTVCPPEGKKPKTRGDDLFGTPLDQTVIDFENEGGETYICGNPPYKGTKNQTKEEKRDLQVVFDGHTTRTGTLDYVAGWFMKAALYVQSTPAEFAFVSTNSLCQGGHVPVLWPILYRFGLTIKFAYQSFKWRNLASHNAGVTVIVVGLSSATTGKKRLFHVGDDLKEVEKACDVIGPYLIPNTTVIVEGRTDPLSELTPMSLGNAPYEGGNLIVEPHEVNSLGLSAAQQKKWLRPLLGSAEVIDGDFRYCIWVEDSDLPDALSIGAIRMRIEAVKDMRLSSKDAGTRAMANRSHQFREMYFGRKNTIIVPIRSSESRPYLPVALFGVGTRVTNLAYAIYDGPLMNLAIIASRLHLVWIAAVCGKLETRFSYSNKMGWHTFPVPILTEQNKTDLTRCAEDILLAREAHFPATIADLYDPGTMPDNLRAAHGRNDETLERIYIGRRFKNDTERLEKLFELYTQMTARQTVTKAGRKAKAHKA